MSGSQFGGRGTNQQIHIAERERMYRLRFERALTGVLFVCVILFTLFKRLPDRPAGLPEIHPLSNIRVDAVPPTRTGRPAQAPARPSVTVPSERERVPADEIIDTADLHRRAENFSSGPASGEGSGAAYPRPIRDAVPEFPDSERKQGARGEVVVKIRITAGGRVDSAVVLGNTTGSRRLAEAAKDAAYRSLFRPVMDPAAGQFFWITRSYRFESD